MSSYTEDHLVEQPAIQLMQHELGWEVNCYDEWECGKSDLGRDGKREVMLVSRLKPALQRLNPDLPVEAIEGAVEEICRDRTARSLAEAIVHELLHFSVPNHGKLWKSLMRAHLGDWETLAERLPKIARNC